jgi:hypothetical protein
MPVKLDWLTPAKQVARGQNHSCALLETGNVQCWGQIFRTRSALSATPNQARRAGIPGGLKATAIGAAVNNTCVLTQNRRLACWEERTDAMRMVKSISLPEPANQLSVGAFFSCALLASAKPRCIITDASLSRVPELVHRLEKLEGIRQLAVSGEHACWVDTAGVVSCMGENSYSQLTLMQPGQVLEAPTPVPGVGPAIAVATSQVMTCAALASGNVSCWGSGAGPRGPGPSQVPALEGLVSISLTPSLSCGKLATGGAACWGYNTYGGVGNREAGSGVMGGVVRFLGPPRPSRCIAPSGHP